MFQRIILLERLTITLLAIACLTIHSQTTLGTEPKSKSHIGKKISPFTLDNCYGRAVSLDKFANKKAIVVAFLGNECPIGGDKRYCVTVF